MKLDENTKISVGIAIAVIGGGAVWLTNISFQTSANAKSLDSIDIRQLEYNKLVQSIEKDIAVIRTKVELIEQRSRGR